MSEILLFDIVREKKVVLEHHVFVLDQTLYSSNTALIVTYKERASHVVNVL